MISELSFDIASLRKAYATGSITPLQVIEECIRRIDALRDDAVWISRFPDEILLKFARDLAARGTPALPLYGLPFAIKDNIDLEGLPTTAGCPEFSYQPQASSQVVTQLILAGAIPIGKTNLDQFATGLVGTRSPYGVPRNPFDPAMVPGGSSSGSAVAVAAGLVSFSLGTDTAGSGRVPAGFQNIVGLKPTRGALSTRGVLPACRSLDCVSIFALTVQDAREVLHTCSELDPLDPYSRSPIPRNKPRHRTQWRVGIPCPGALSFCGDGEAKALYDQAIARVITLGGEVVEIDFSPFKEAAALLYQGPWIAERWADLREFYTRKGPEKFLPITRQILEKAITISAADAFAGFHRLEELKRSAGEIWADVDFLLLPTTPTIYTIAQVNEQPVTLNSNLGYYTNFVNLLDCSALAVPSGFKSNGLPFGITLVGPAWDDELLSTFGDVFQRSVGGPMGATRTQLNQVPVLAPDQRTMEKETVLVAVVGAHLSGLPLNHQLTTRHAQLVRTTKTAPLYKFFALPGTLPPKPGLVRIVSGEVGGSIEVEIWEMNLNSFGSFVAGVPQPLTIGTIVLADLSEVKGFICEGYATLPAEDITAHEGWKRYLAATQERAAG